MYLGKVFLYRHAELKSDKYFCKALSAVTINESSCAVSQFVTLQDSRPLQNLLSVSRNSMTCWQIVFRCERSSVLLKVWSKSSITGGGCWFRRFSKHLGLYPPFCFSSLPQSWLLEFVRKSIIFCALVTFSDYHAASGGRLRAACRGALLPAMLLSHNRLICFICDPQGRAARGEREGGVGGREVKSHW